MFTRVLQEVLGFGLCDVMRIREKASASHRCCQILRGCLIYSGVLILWLFLKEEHSVTRSCATPRSQAEVNSLWRQSADVSFSLPNVVLCVAFLQIGRIYLSVGIHLEVSFLIYVFLEPGNSYVPHTVCSLVLCGFVEMKFHALLLKAVCAQS